MLTTKWDHEYTSTLCWLCCRLAFSLLCSSIQAIRGARTSCGHAIKMPVVDLIDSESHFSHHCKDKQNSTHYFIPLLHDIMLVVLLYMLKLLQKLCGTQKHFCLMWSLIPPTLLSGCGSLEIEHIPTCAKLCLCALG